MRYYKVQAGYSVMFGWKPKKQDDLYWQDIGAITFDSALAAAERAKELAEYHYEDKPKPVAFRPVMVIEKPMNKVFKIGVKA